MSYLIRKLMKEDWPDVKRIYEAGLATGLATFETEAPSYEKWINQSSPACRLVYEKQPQVQGWCKVAGIFPEGV